MTIAVEADLDSPAGAARPVSPRLSLPNGRAVAGALLVTVAAVGTYLTAAPRPAPPTTVHPTIARPVAAGDVIEAAQVSAQPAALPVSVAATVATSVDDVVGATALRDLRPGDIVRADDVTSTPVAAATVSRHEVSIPVDRHFVDFQLVPGDRVTLLATDADGDPPTTVAVEDAIVSDWSIPGDGIGASSVAILTLALPDPGTVMAVVDRARRSDLTVVRTTRAIADVYPAATTGNQP